MLINMRKVRIDGTHIFVATGALFFVKPIRSKNYVTLMDPFQKKYGNVLAAVIFIPALLADIFWIASILGILGKSETTS